MNEKNKWQPLSPAILNNAKNIHGRSMPIAGIIKDEKTPLAPRMTLDEWLNKEKEPGEFFYDDKMNEYDYNAISGELKVTMKPYKKD